MVDSFCIPAPLLGVHCVYFLFLYTYTYQKEAGTIQENVRRITFEKWALHFLNMFKNGLASIIPSPPLSLFFCSF